MVPSLTTILQRFTGEWATLLQPDAILAVCSEIGYTAWRDRVLTPVTRRVKIFEPGFSPGEAVPKERTSVRRTPEAARANSPGAALGSAQNGRYYS